jgi:hypothetical protein
MAGFRDKTKINYAPEAGRYKVQSQPVAFWE